MQRDEFKIYLPIEPIIHPSIQTFKSILHPAPAKPEPTQDPLDEYVLSEAERLILNNRRTDAKETFLIKMSKHLKQRLKSAAESRCVTLNDMLNTALREWVNEFEKSESRRRGD